MQEIAGIQDLVEVQVYRAPKIQAWMLILLLMFFILFIEFRNNRKAKGVINTKEGIYKE